MSVKCSLITVYAKHNSFQIMTTVVFTIHVGIVNDKSDILKRNCMLSVVLELFLYYLYMQKQDRQKEKPL